ncbi:glycoside hydrolase family 25 protein [Aureimonas leprariae]|uniref:Glycoside hydrolase family 25 protein n=1 Tax=Plantimonas leprariae TaxID=2615207 RepID=A0A7V7PQZ1_9HYPH|nr:GH25 family lysozyme [Aureimonas leprariae]KAB0680812.1 glycoside hydrolase family 25 protein [Aureimonas leprariae]
MVLRWAIGRPGAYAALALWAALLPAGGCTSTTLDPVALGLDGHAGTSPEDYPVHGIDLSKYQGDVDWPAAKKGGVAFAYLKATEGGDRVDAKFAENWAAARAVGMPRGAYHFFYHCRTGKEQARWFIANVPRDPDALPPVLDVEWTPDSPTCTKRPPRDDLMREMQDFLDTVEKYYGVRPILYVPIDVHRDRLVGAFPRYEFWLRAVKDHPSAVYEGRPFRFWQWTATGTVPGVSGEVDRNAFSGSRADWTKWLGARRPRRS